MNEKSEEDGAPPPPSLPHNHAYETLDEIVSVSLSLFSVAKSASNLESVLRRFALARERESGRWQKEISGFLASRSFKTTSVSRASTQRLSSRS